jgi:HD-like signal output (HDOD) protein
MTMALVPPNIRGMDMDASQEIPGDGRSDILRTRIPALPPIAMKALDMLADPDFNLRMLAGVLAEDKLLAARILAIGRAPYYRQRIVPASLQAALQVIGLRDLRNIIFTSALRNLSAATPESLWAHLVGAALACRILAAQVPGMDPEQAFLAGLMHDAGQIIFLRDDAAGYTRLVANAREEKTFLFDAEEAHYGESHASSGAALARVWSTDPAIAAAIAAHHHACTDVKSLPALVIVADHLTLKAGLGFFAPAPAVPPEILSAFGVGDEAGLARALAALRNAYDTEGALLVRHKP